MTEKRSRSTIGYELASGQPPADAQALMDMTVGTDVWLDTLVNHYLQRYIAFGGGKIKFLSGKAGVGKTHSLRYICHVAQKMGYAAVLVNAAEIRLQRIDILYQEIATRVELSTLIEAYSINIARQIGGADLSADGGSQSVVSILARRLGSDKLAQERLKVQLRGLLKLTQLNRSFSTAITHLCQDYLGLRELPVRDKQTLYDWLTGKHADSATLRRMQVYTRLDRYNGRQMLGSLFAFVRLAGYSGTLICIDAAEALVADKPGTSLAMYSRIARNDAYELMRQLIDEADYLPSTLFVIAARPELFKSEDRGVKTYYALWLRIQQEITTRRLNPMADQVSLDSVFDPPSPNSAEDIVMRAIFGEQPGTVRAGPTPDERIALEYLGELSTRVARIAEGTPLQREQTVTILRA
jgi:hypothetical protein